jgi:hypothetical protein
VLGKIAKIKTSEPDLFFFGREEVCGWCSAKSEHPTKIVVAA